MNASIEDGSPHEKVPINYMNSLSHFVMMQALNLSYFLEDYIASDPVVLDFVSNYFPAKTALMYDDETRFFPGIEGEDRRTRKALERHERTAPRPHSASHPDGSQQNP